MVNILTQTKIAMIGIARPLVMNPQLVSQLQAGDYQEKALPRLSTGLASLDRKVGSYIGLSYYEQQMHRIAQGKNPIWTQNAWSALLFALRHQGLAAIIPKRS